MSANPMKQAIEQLKNMTLLYVEDEPSAREEIVYFLENRVKKLYTAKDGLEGYALFSENCDTIDIVITDIQMPGCNGLEMAEKIKALKPDTPIVITSAFNDSDYLFKAIETGINNYITKPVDLMQLIQKISSIAQQITMQQQLIQTRKSLEYYQKAIDQSTLLTKHDTNLKILSVNEKLCTLTGYSSEQLIGEEEFFLWEKRDREQHYDRFIKRLKEERYAHEIIYYHAKNNHPLIVDVTAFAIVDESDNIEGYIFIRNDITELFNYRKLLEERLNVNQKDLNEKIHFLNQYQKALDLGTALCRINISGQITYANNTFIGILGLEGQEVVGRNYFALCQFDNGFSGIGALKQNIYEKDVYNASVLHKAINGKNVYLNTAYIPIFDLERNVIEIVCIHHDLTTVIELNHEINDTQREIIYILGEVTESRSNETGNHIKRVAEYSALLAKYMGYDRHEVETIKIASTMHDIGKIAIEDAILKKPGKLTDEEFERMKEHASIGYNIFKNSKRPILQAAAIIAKEHHEKWDGSGYPQKLKGEEIHPYGRIVALADVFDALGTNRVYKKAWDIDRILTLFKEERGKHFDPQLIDIFFAHLDEFIIIRDTYADMEN
jgi:PAS domain S-box-containing protein